MISILIVIIGISILILIHELGHFLAAKYFGVGVEEFGIGFPPRMISKKIGETRYSVNWLPLGGFVKLKGEFSEKAVDSSAAPTAVGAAEAKLFVKQKVWQRAVILAGGVFMNFLLGWLLLSLILFIGAPQFILVNNVLPNSVAEEASIMKGDRILGFSSAKDLTEFIKKNSGNEITLEILRFSENKQAKLQITAIPRDSLGIMITDIGLPAQPFLAALAKGFASALSIIWSILISLGKVFSAPESFVGPIGIINIALETGKLGVIYVLQLLALISLNLVVLNMLPIPALDGGRLFFLLIEKLRGKSFLPKTEIKANTIGFVALIFLIFVITITDIWRLF